MKGATMYWLKIGNVMVNLAQVTDVDLNVRAGAKTPPLVAINFASLALVDGELEGRTLYFSGQDAIEIRGYFSGLSGKQMTTLTTREVECSPCPPSEAVSSNKKLQQVFVPLNVKDLRAALADPEGRSRRP